MPRKKMPKRIFAVIENDVVPKGSKPQELYAGLPEERIREDLLLEKFWEEDVMLSGCVKHPREWYGITGKDIPVGVYELVEEKIIAALDESEIDDDVAIRIPDKFK